MPDLVPPPGELHFLLTITRKSGEVETIPCIGKPLPSDAPTPSQETPSK